MNLPALETNSRILIIDDNPAIHADFQKILGRTRVTPTALANAEASLFGDDSAPAPRAVAKLPAFELASAHQGKEGYAMVQQALAEGRPYALAFVDIRMPPGWDGVETMHHIWQIDPEIQIVICTAYSDYSWEEMTGGPERADSVLILKKPFDNIEVVQLSHALTKKWTLAQQARLSMEMLDQLVEKRTQELNKTLLRLQDEMSQKASVQASLRVSEERFSKAFRASPFPMAIVHLGRDRFADCNDAFLAMIQRSREEVIDQTSADFALWPDPGTPDSLRTRIQDGISISNLELLVAEKNGQSRKTLVSAETFSLGDEHYAILIWQDLSERLRLEDQLRQAQKMEAVGQLAAGVAHDFNNILTVIQGHASLCLLAQGLTPNARTSLEQISTAADRAATLTRQLLAFSRKQIMQLRSLNLNDSVSGLLSMLQRLIGEHIRLKTALDSSVPSIHADHGSLEQVIMNLVVNARDAMPEGGDLIISTSTVKITAAYQRQHPGSQAGHFVRLTVTDTGTGMDAATREHIFEPFFTTKEVGKGTGMGLATVYGIVQQHSGWVEVESTPGVGSTFHIYLPTSLVKEEKIELKPAASTVAPRGTETIFVVEDEENLRLLVETILQEQGYKTVCASNGVEALKIWATKKDEIDLLLTDVVMPEAISGIQLAERMLKTRPELKVIFTSGYSLDLIAKGHDLRDGENFLPKPYPPIKLANAVRSCLDAPVPRTAKPARKKNAVAENPAKPAKPTRKKKA